MAKVQHGCGYDSNGLIHIVALTERHFKKLETKGMRAEIQFKNPNLENMDEWMSACFDQLLLIISNILKINPQDRVGFSFVNSENDKINFYISFRRFDQYTPEVISSALNNVLQSNVNFLIDDKVSINVDHVSIPTGGSRRACIGKSRENLF